MFKFDERDLAPYHGKNPGWGEVGLVTYTRTYSRPIYKNGGISGRESWLDTCVRVIEGSMNLVPTDPTATREWALKALDMMFHMAWIPSGRGLWMLGTEYAQQRGGDALNNCWWINVEPHSYENIKMFENTYLFSHPAQPMPSFSFVFAADRLMLGGGVGFGVSNEYIDRFPIVSRPVRLKIVLDKNHQDWDRIKSSEEYAEISQYLVDHSMVSLPIPDSREGWNICLREVIDAHWYQEEDTMTYAPLRLDLSNIRPYGAEIKGFGGTSSGVLPLISGLVSINRVLNSRVGKQLRSIDAVDIMNIIGKIVVSGNVRRSALLALGEPTDGDYVNAKNYRLVQPILEVDKNGNTVWVNIDGKFVQKKKPYDQCIKELGKEKTDELLELMWKQQDHRWASNNSVYTDDNFDDFHYITAGILANGEPGLVNRDLIKYYGRIKDGRQETPSQDTGVNPCGEITLEDEEPCNLVEVIPSKCEEHGYNIFDVIQIATEYAYRITFDKYIWPQTQRVIDKNHRMGVSLTGEQDYFLAKYGHYSVKGYEDGDCTKPIFYEDVEEELDIWYKHVKKVNTEHAKLLSSTPSVKLTTCKPSGTVAKLPGVSSGIHFHYAPYMIQRIRFHNTDPNLRVLEMCKYPIEPDHQAPNTMVVEFPVKAPNADHPNFKCAGDVSLEEQFANQYLFAYAWADNAVSATLTFQKFEANKIEPLLRAYRDRIKSTSLLPYSGHGYQQAPWEPITKEEYERRKSDLIMSLEDAYDIVNFEESGELIEDGCSQGVCPLR